jgi:POT family proton-dependent oligopeptide transporter
MKAPGGTWFGYPKGIFLVAFTELWERFSYYGLVGLLVLYLTRTTGEGGFGWAPADAVRLYGFYTGLIFCAPVLGGWLANQHFGERRCIVWGGAFIVFGHVLLGGPAYWPDLAGRWAGVDAAAALRGAGIVLGELFPETATWEKLAAFAGDPAALPALRFAYVASAWSFMGGLVFIVLGTAFIKPTISSIVAQFYERGDPRKDSAFSVFWMCIYLGTILGYFVAGALGERLGWHYGFMAAGVGMSLGLAVHLWKQQAWLADLGAAPVARDPAVAAEPLSREERDRLAVLFVQSAFVVVYAVAFYQKGGLLNLYGREHTDRMLGGFEIPATWFLSINPIVFVLAVPVFDAVWRRLAARGVRVAAATKLVFGLVVLASGYLFMLGAVQEAGPGLSEKSSLFWLLGLYLMFGIGDALVWPVQMSLASKLAPPRYTALTIGGWYIVVGVGTWLTALVGPLAYRVGFEHVFYGLISACLLAAALLALLRPALARRSHGAEEPVSAAPPP